MKIDKAKIYVVEIVLFAILSFALFVSNSINPTTISIVLAVCAFISWKTIKKRKIESIHAQKVSTLLIIFAIIYLIGFYAMGLYFWYYKTAVIFDIVKILKNIIPITIIIISSEVLRNIFLAQNTKYNKIILFCILVLTDIIIYSGIYNLTSKSRLIELLGTTLFAAISCNLLYNYISIRYGIKGNIIYRLITTLYV